VYSFLNNKLVPAKAAKISALDHSFLYGDGVFTTLRTYKGQVLHLKEHFLRLQNNAKTLGIPLSFSLEQLESNLQKLVAKNHLKDARIRVTVSRSKTVLIHSEPLKIDQNIYKKGVSAFTCNLVRTLPEIKTTSLIHMVVAYREIKPKGGYEAILVDQKNFVREGASTNLFIVKNGTIITPKTKMLPGITRAKIIKIAKRLHLPLHIRDFKTKLLLRADEIFLTNAVREIIPVTSLNGKKVGKGVSSKSAGQVGKITKILMEAYQDSIKSSLRSSLRI
jgi:branched-chain amino acid aminotransferase